MRRIFMLSGAVVLVACGNTYHPEYHPVTVTDTSQNLSYPVSVNNGGNPAERSPVIVAPAPQAATIPVPAPPYMPPEAWFREYDRR